MLRKEGHSERAIFIIDKTGIIRYVDVHDIDTQPDNDVLFQVLGEVDPQAGGMGRPAPHGANCARRPPGRM